MPRQLPFLQMTRKGRSGVSTRPTLPRRETATQPEEPLDNAGFAQLTTRSYVNIKLNTHVTTRNLPCEQDCNRPRMIVLHLLRARQLTAGARTCLGTPGGDTGPTTALQNPFGGLACLQPL